jgi:hypothetical protein
MIRSLGMLWGILFLLGGILGFVPGITKDDMFLGIFMVNTAHGIVHITSGAIFLIASALGARAARLWFQVFGFFYAAAAVMGFEVGDGMIFGVISNNRYDAWGHAVLALVLLLIGFFAPKRAAAA